MILNIKPTRPIVLFVSAVFKWATTFGRHYEKTIYFLSRQAFNDILCLLVYGNVKTVGHSGAAELFSSLIRN